MDSLGIEIVKDFRAEAMDCSDNILTTLSKSIQRNLDITRVDCLELDPRELRIVVDILGGDRKVAGRVAPFAFADQTVPMESTLFYGLVWMVFQELMRGLKTFHVGHLGNCRGVAG